MHYKEYNDFLKAYNRWIDLAESYARVYIAESYDKYWQNHSCVLSSETQFDEDSLTIPIEWGIEKDYITVAISILEASQEEWINHIRINRRMKEEKRQKELELEKQKEKDREVAKAIEVLQNANYKIEKP